MSRVHTQEYMSQVLDFVGATTGKGKSFTDIDAVMEYSDKAYVIVEVKYKDGRPPKGQILALERMARDLGRIKPTILILAEHHAPMGENVILATCRVRWMMEFLPSKSYTTPDKRWQKASKQRSVMSIVRAWLREVEHGRV